MTMTMNMNAIRLVATVMYMEINKCSAREEIVNYWKSAGQGNRRKIDRLPEWHKESRIAYETCTSGVDDILGSWLLTTSKVSCKPRFPNLVYGYNLKSS